MTDPSEGEAHPRGDFGAGAPPGSVPELFGSTGTALADGAGRITGWSQAMERLLGLAAGEVIGRSAGFLLAPPPGPDPPTDRAAASDAPAASPPPADAGRVPWGNAGEPWSGVVKARHRDGHTVPMAVEATPLTGSGQQTQWLLSAVGLAGPTSGTAVAPLLRTLMERSPIAFAVWDTEMRCLWLNNTASQQAGRARAERSMGWPLPDAAALGYDVSAVEPTMRRVLDDGRPVIDHEVRRTRRTGEERIFSASFFRLEAADGTPQGLCTVGIDVGDSIARRRLALLSRAGTRIGTTLDIMTTAQELADVAVPVPADFVTVDLADWVPLGEIPRERPGGSAFGRPAFRRAGIASVHKGVPEAVFARGEMVFQPPSSPIVKPLITGESHFEPRLDTAHYWLREDPARDLAIRKAGMHSAMFVPLKARDAILGVAVFARTDNPVPFTRDDLLLAEDLAVQAALSLDNARRYARERNTALALQRNLLPCRLSGGAGLDVASRYLPADKHGGVGGDWYDAIPLSQNRIALVVGDVVGHGINAAAAMGRLRTAVHTLAALDLPPDQLLARLDQVALHLTEEADEPERSDLSALAATCIYAVYDPATRICTLARAGHPPPAIVTPERKITFAETPAGAPVGYGVAAYESVDLRLAAGSTIALFTDGLIETRGDDIDAGLDRLAAALCHDARDLEEQCTHIVDTMLRGTTPEDDISLLLAQTHTGRPPDTESVAACLELRSGR